MEVRSQPRHKRGIGDDYVALAALDDAVLLALELGHPRHLRRLTLGGVDPPKPLGVHLRRGK